MRRITATACLFALAACSDASGPGSPRGDVIYALGGETHQLVVINPRTGTVIARVNQPAMRNYGYSATWSNDSSELYFPAFDSSGGAIYSLDAASLSIRHVIDLVFDETPANRDALLFFGDELTMAPGDSALYDGSAELPVVHTTVTAVIDPARGQLTGVIATTRSWQIAGLPVGPVADPGTLVGVGPRFYDSDFASVFFIRPGSSVPTESFGLAGADVHDFSPPIWIFPSPNGRVIYVESGAGGVYAVDLVDKAIVGSAHIGRFGYHMAMAPDGSHLYAVGGGEPGTDPSLRKIRVFDAMLAEQPSIDLDGQSALEGTVPPLEGLVLSRDGKSLYIAAGTSSLVGTAKDAVLVMDLASDKITHVVPLDQWGYLTLFTGR